MASVFIPYCIPEYTTEPGKLLEAGRKLLEHSKKIFILPSLLRGDLDSIVDDTIAPGVRLVMNAGQVVVTNTSLDKPTLVAPMCIEGSDTCESRPQPLRTVCIEHGILLRYQVPSSPVSSSVCGPVTRSRSRSAAGSVFSDKKESSVDLLVDSDPADNESVFGATGDDIIMNVDVEENVCLMDEEVLGNQSSSDDNEGFCF